MTPIPTPIDATLTRARQHLLTRTLAGHPAPVVTAALLTPAVLKAVAHVNAMADTGDVLATQAACQTWAKALAKALKETV